jgi:hypothetical protein
MTESEKFDLLVLVVEESYFRIFEPDINILFRE